MVAYELQNACMFCKKNKDKVLKLFLGKNAKICDECVKIAFIFKNGNTNDMLNIIY